MFKTRQMCLSENCNCMYFFSGSPPIKSTVKISSQSLLWVWQRQEKYLIVIPEIIFSLQSILSDVYSVNKLIWALPFQVKESENDSVIRVAEVHISSPHCSGVLMDFVFNCSSPVAIVGIIRYCCVNISVFISSLFSL